MVAPRTSPSELVLRPDAPGYLPGEPIPCTLDGADMGDADNAVARAWEVAMVRTDWVQPPKAGTPLRKVAEAVVARSRVQRGALPGSGVATLWPPEHLPPTVEARTVAVRYHLKAYVVGSTTPATFCPVVILSSASSPDPAAVAHRNMRRRDLDVVNLLWPEDRVARAGASFSAGVRLTVRSPLAVAEAYVELSRQEDRTALGRFGRPTGQVISQSVSVARSGLEIPGSLPPGDHEYRYRIDIPPAACPSYRWPLGGDRRLTATVVWTVRSVVLPVGSTDVSSIQARPGRGPGGGGYPKWMQEQWGDSAAWSEHTIRVTNAP
jgi:hypothetical protein